MENYETQEYKGYTINIGIDEYPSDPRKEWDNLGIMVCWHRRYDLGDNHNFSDPQEFAETWNNHNAFILPLYLYDHSGITISTSKGYPFNDPWDAGQVGYIYVSKDAIRKEWGVKRISPKLRNTVLHNLYSEVETYDAYLTGAVFGYGVTDPDGNETEMGCWGFYGEMDYMIGEAQSAIDYHIEQEEAKAQREKCGYHLAEMGVKLAA